MIGNLFCVEHHPGTRFLDPGDRPGVGRSDEHRRGGFAGEPAPGSCTACGFDNARCLGAHVGVGASSNRRSIDERGAFFQRAQQT
jgi:hypothetical protein